MMFIRIPFQEPKEFEACYNDSVATDFKLDKTEVTLVDHQSLVEISLEFFKFLLSFIKWHIH